jgi:uncharacterized membrane protein YkoI
METNHPADQKSNEVDNIRNILFGEQIRQVTTQFDLVEKSINSLRLENQNLRQALEMEVSKREQEIKKLDDLILAIISGQIETLGSILTNYHKEKPGELEKVMLENRKRPTK